MKKIPVLLILILIGIVILAAIFYMKPSPTSLYPLSAYPSGITGNAMVGPTCPVSTPDGNCKDAPFQGKFILLSGDNATVVQGFSTDSSGKFSITAKPGNYTIKLNSAAAMPTCEPVKVSVTADNFSTVSISCDSGIR